MGDSNYGEPAWPNELLYVFPVVMLGIVGLCVGLAFLDPAMIGEPANPFATPLDFLPEWYLYPVFQIIGIVPNKLLGIAAMVTIPLALLCVPLIESVNKFQNPFRCPVAMAVFLFGTLITLWLGIGATFPIDESITHGKISDPGRNCKSRLAHVGD